ncbi:MAG: Type II secretion system F domain protein [Candidatus Woesebacteria bacterium GW2011_GWB1_38_8]|uniref:Type II secretion system F domain protein n=1 Tax=Candidatus Woesebacteria bacterium GW2011_GWB1_38_8 TaxID=1618570 RepID=A0A0G0LD99_9BACT|nr:MAG: Type II secretion system F domain protein [Candidatus Woesebacteria bacterium GW2011_GWB1_38_8]
MKRYRYKAKNEKGELVIGEVEASTFQHAAKLVREQRLVVISLSNVHKISLDSVTKIFDRFSGGDVTNFTRQLATMVSAGLPITEALLILRSQSKGSMQKVVAQILADIEEGESMSASFARHPHVFSKTYIALVRSGELGGVLDQVLIQLADDMEKQQEFTGRVKGAMIYPAVIVFGMIAVAFIMIIFVIPRLTTLYEQFGSELPASTKLLIFISKIFGRFWPIVILLVFAAFYAFKMYRATKAGKKKVDEVMLKIPIIGELQKQIILTDLTRTLALMITSGVSIIEALQISAQVVKSAIISEALEDTIKLVEKGFPIAFAFSKHPEAFPFILSQMIAVGEETGKMDEVLKKISHVFEVESDRKLKALTAAVEPVVLIVLGLGVAFMVISLILPIYNLTTSL